MKKKLSPEAKELRRLYAKAWRAKNPDKVRENNRRYWERKAQQAASEGNKTEVDGNG